MRRPHLEPIGAAATGLGLAVLALAILAPDSWFHSGEWTTDRAVAHQTASAELHRLSLSAERTEEHLEQLRQAREKMGDLEVTRKQSAEAPARWRSALRWTGGGFCLFGAGLVLASRGGRG